MRYVLMIMLMIVFACPAWGNSCYSQAAGFISVPHDKPSTITLESRRVKTMNDNRLTYDLGKETITITADSFAAQNFLKSVASGRCSARETVALEPERKSPFNTRFKAVNVRYH